MPRATEINRSDIRIGALIFMAIPKTWLESHALAAMALFGLDPYRADDFVATSDYLHFDDTRSLLLRGRPNESESGQG